MNAVIKECWEPVLKKEIRVDGIWRRQVIRFQVALLLGLLGGISAAAQVVITPATPPVVSAGATFQFTANVPVTWSMAPGSAGTINASTGLYTAPPSVTAKQSYGSCQVLPNNHVFNTRIDNLPVHASSAAWLAVAKTGSINYFPSFPLNHVDASTPVQNMVFTYTPLNNGPFQIPAYPNARIESGWLVPASAPVDRHFFAIDTTNCMFEEMYNLYAAGSNTQCPNCTSQSGVRYSNTSYALAVNGATDAASLYILPLSLHIPELLQAAATGGTINHALRVTMPAGWVSNSFIWPAMRVAPSSGPIPYGARFRLKPSFNIATFSPIAQVLLRQLQQYGVILTDIGAQWQINFDYEKYSPSVHSAFDEVAAAITPAQLEAVDESSLMLSPSSGDTNVGAETVVATAVTGGLTAKSRVILAGVTIGVPAAQKYIQVGTPPQQFTAWVHGSSNTGVTWSMNPVVGTLSAGGLYTPPASLSSVTATTVTATSNADSTVSAQMNLTVFPAGTIRIVNGSSTPYTDTQGNVWAASTGDDGCGPYNNGGPYPAIPDIYLYETDCFAPNDLRFDFTVPNGNYLVTAKFAATCCSAGFDHNSLEVQGQIIYSNIDFWLAAGGRNQPIDYRLPASVTNNLLSFVIRRGVGNSAFIAALQIAPLAASTTTSPPATPLTLTATPH
jgi:hypothetical protein